MTPTDAPPTPPQIAGRLLRWYDRHGRKSLPWRRARDPYPRDPYPIWVAEIMLQQTQVGTVIPYYRRFMARFPDLAALARCDADELLHYWSGLGYYARARNLHAAARQIADLHGGRFPARFDQVLALPGIGRSTAGAILAFAFGQRHPILDGNVKRVLSRYCAVKGYPGAARVQRRLWQIAERLTPKERVADYTQALMDLGATVCVHAKPLCTICPLAADCRARQMGKPAAFPEPKPKPASARPRKAVTMLIVRNRRAELLLVKRPPSGIWGGLWSLPEYEHRARPAPAQMTPAQRRCIEQWCERQLGVAVKTGEALPVMTHSFTHFDLDILPLPARCTGGGGSVMDARQYLWYNPSSPAQIGVPAAVKRILGLLNESEGAVR